MQVTSGSYGTCSLLPLTLGVWPWPCLLHVCSDVAAPFGSARYQAAALKSAGSAPAARVADLAGGVGLGSPCGRRPAASAPLASAALHAYALAPAVAAGAGNQASGLDDQ